MGASYKGVYSPSKKYRGTLPCVYRSLPELRLMQWMDRQQAIVEWTSESVVIPYVKPTDGRVHRYYMDFSCVFVDSTGQRLRYLIEYKPYKQTIPPVETPKRNQRTLLMEKLTFAVNMAKWKAAREYARANKSKFLIVTERNLG